MLNEHENEIHSLNYPALGGRAPVIDLERPVSPADRIRDLESKLAATENRFAGTLESARREALERGRQQAGGEQTAWREQSGAQLQDAIGRFQAQQEEYFARVEHEVVRLALAVAERILHRETQLDPMLLSGAVRVALGQLAESTAVRLRVAAGEKEMWAEMVRLMPRLPLRPEVCGDERLKSCEAILETSMGTLDLGVQAQLAEIERSFFEGHGTTGEANAPDAEQRG